MITTVSCREYQRSLEDSEYIIINYYFRDVCKLMLGPKAIGSKGSLWKLIKTTPGDLRINQDVEELVHQLNGDNYEYVIDEQAPQLNPDQDYSNRLVLTSEGLIYNANNDQLLDFTPPLKQLITYQVNPIVFGITLDDRLIRISIRSQAFKTIRRNVIHIAHYSTLERGGVVNGGFLNIIDENGDHLALVLDRRLDRITEEENRGYISNQIFKRRNQFLFTADGLFQIDLSHNDLILKIDTPPETEGIIVDAIIGYSADDSVEYIVLLDNDGNLFSTVYEIGYPEFDFQPCNNEFIIERNEYDRWIKLIPARKDGRVGLAGISGRVCLINENLAIESTQIPTEIFRLKPTQSKSARNIAHRRG